MAFDLAAYLQRIHLKAVPPADADGLHLIQRHQRLTIPFECLDVGLGRPIALDQAALVDKLIVRRRGGYCFEQNLLFLAALHATGFDARPLLARVWLGASEVPPRTHMLLLATIDGERWIADAGFGGSYAPPLRLVDGTEAESAGGVRHRLRHDAEQGWMLERHGPAAATDGRGAGDGWLPQYSFTEDEVWPTDIDLSNHWTSTSPASRFVQHRVVSLVLPGGFAALTDRRYTRWTERETVEAEIASAKAYRLRLNFVFGIDLSEAEIEGLGLY